MEWTQTTVEIWVFASLCTALTLCGVAGFCMRARIEQGIRGEYRVLFGACRRSMAQPNEYDASPRVPLEQQKTTEFRRPAPRIKVPVAPAMTTVHDLSSLARNAERELGRVLTTGADGA
jgi:hypothetical protein